MTVSRLESSTVFPAFDICGNLEDTDLAGGPAEPSTAPDHVSIYEGNVVASLAERADPAQIRLEISNHVGRLGRLVLKPDGRMYIYDQHLDIFSRFAFPIAYAIAIGVVAARRTDEHLY